MAHYTLHAPEAGTYTEIYLPKKAAYQGPLFHALTEGFLREVVEPYLTDAKHRAELEEFMRPAKEFYDVSIADNLPDFFWNIYEGYSLYEVDGVFRPKQTATPSGVIEERTQVIRVIFRLNLDAIMETPIESGSLQQAELLARAYLRSHHWSRELFLEEYMACAKPTLSREESTLILKSVEKWARSVGLFLFGYIVRRIAEIAKEEEIWVTFLWNLIVGRVEKAQVTTHAD